MPVTSSSQDHATLSSSSRAASPFQGTEEPTPFRPKCDPPALGPTPTALCPSRIGTGQDSTQMGRQGRPRLPTGAPTSHSRPRTASTMAVGAVWSEYRWRSARKRAAIEVCPIYVQNIPRDASKFWGSQELNGRVTMKSRVMMTTDEGSCLISTVNTTPWRSRSTSVAC